MTCALCNLSVPSHAIVDNHLTFCCSGCHTVFSILAAQKINTPYLDTPLFKKALESGLISNPQLLQELESKVEIAQESRRLYLEVTDLWCPSCAEVIRFVLMRKKGVKNCSVDYTTDFCIIEYYPQLISKASLISSITSLGYTPQAVDCENEGKVSFQLYLRLAIAAFAALNLMMFAYPIYVGEKEYGLLFAWISLLVAIPCIFYSAFPILKRFVISLKTGVYGMETLVSMGISSALALSLYDLSTGSDKVYFDSMSMIVVFVLWGKIIESKAKFSAKSAILRLSRVIPKRARKRFAKDMRFVPIKEVEVGDILLAFTGEKIVMDGKIIEGGGAIDESAMTGEFAPLYKGVDSEVIGGSIVKNGWIAFQVIHKMKDSFFQQVVDVLQGDLQKKERKLSVVDTIVRIFVPSVLTLAALSILFSMLSGSSFQEAWLRGMAIVFISCPCAIGIAVPLVEAHLMNQLVSSGVIIRNRKIFPLLRKQPVVIFDKTGTLTQGKFQVLSGLEILSDHERAILKSMTSHSSHPVSTAICESILSESVLLKSIEERAGMGLVGVLENGDTYYLGSKTLIPQAVAPLRGTYVFFATPSQVITLTLGDVLRDDAKEVVSSFERVILLSGDSREAVEDVAMACCIREWHFEKNPLQKRAIVEELRASGHTVVMVGDGINDAPALASADIGIAMLSGTDLSMQVCDVLLSSQSLLGLRKLFVLGSRAQTLSRQNLFLAFFYNVIGIGLALFGFFAPIIAAIAMTSSSIIVILNALRINLYPSKSTPG